MVAIDCEKTKRCRIDLGKVTLNCGWGPVSPRHHASSHCNPETLTCVCGKHFSLFSTKEHRSHHHSTSITTDHALVHIFTTSVRVPLDAIGEQSAFSQIRKSFTKIVRRQSRFIQNLMHLASYVFYFFYGAFIQRLLSHRTNPFYLLEPSHSGDALFLNGFRLRPLTSNTW